MIGLAIRNCVPSISRRASGTGPEALAAVRQKFLPSRAGLESQNGHGNCFRIAQQGQDTVEYQDAGRTWCASGVTPSNRPFSRTEAIGCDGKTITEVGDISSD
jgi:hypothetical protein